MRLDLKGINRVSFNNFTEYDSEKCHNGGCYGFWREYNRLENGYFEVSYGTTSEFDFCPVCGSFENHYQGDDSCYESGYSCGEFEIVTEEKLLELINNFEETDKKHIEFK